MTEQNSQTPKPSKQSEELELNKKTLKDLPETGEDVKGGVRKTTMPTICSSTVICG